MKNHLLVLNQLAGQRELDKISEYLKSMCEETCKNTGNIHTGNLTVDALIDIKKQAALAENITFICELKLTEQIPLEDFDLCIVLGNLLDNGMMDISLEDSQFCVSILLPSAYGSNQTI